MAKELSKTYDPKAVEEKVYQEWIDGGYFHAEVDEDEKTVYCCHSAAERDGSASYGTRAG